MQHIVYAVVMSYLGYLFDCRLFSCCSQLVKQYFLIYDVGDFGMLTQSATVSRAGLFWLG